MTTAILPNGHPIHFLLRTAATGKTPTRADLDRFLVRDDLPEGDDLNRYRKVLVAAIDDIVGIKATGNNRAARDLADDVIGKVAQTMTDSERALTEADPNPEPLAAIGERMFNNH